MHTETSYPKTVANKSAICILILLAIVLCIGIYLIWTTALIAKDGVTFIEYAKGLETKPIKTIRQERQHPGYPLLILAAHQVAKTAIDGSSLWSWIYSAQAVTLLSRLLAVTVLYFVGKLIVGPKFSLLSILILIMLPNPAELGSDALSDWPHIFFLASGFLLLIRGAMGGKWWLFGIAGAASGLGYLIRPECVQLIVYGVLWLLLQLFWTKHTIDRNKVVLALVSLIIGFVATAAPYILIKGSISTKKPVGLFAFALPVFAGFALFGLYLISKPVTLTKKFKLILLLIASIAIVASVVFLDVAGATVKLTQNIGETLMWFFVPALLIGLYKNFRKQDWYEPDKFFTAALIFLNIPVMILLYHKYGYMSRRHTLPLIAFTIFYIPAGLQIIATWLNEKLFQKVKQLSVIKTDSRFWFIVLLATGICICVPKLLGPTREKKQYYLEAAKWLRENTDKNTIVAAPDPRIYFYSERRGLEYFEDLTPDEARYAVRIIKNQEDTHVWDEMLQAEVVFTVKDKGGKPRIIIYRQMPPS